MLPEALSLRERAERGGFLPRSGEGKCEVTRIFCLSFALPGSRFRALTWASPILPEGEDPLDENYSDRLYSRLLETSLFVHSLRSARRRFVIPVPPSLRRSS